MAAAAITSPTTASTHVATGPTGSAPTAARRLLLAGGRPTPLGI